MQGTCCTCVFNHADYQKNKHYLRFISFYLEQADSAESTVTNSHREVPGLRVNRGHIWCQEHILSAASHSEGGKKTDGKSNKKNTKRWFIMSGNSKKVVN